MWRWIQGVLFGALIEQLDRIEGAIMAIGPATTAAVAEVKAAIAAETEQAAKRLIEHFGADEETAAEVRSILAPIKGIIPDDEPATGGEDTSGDGGGPVVVDPPADGGVVDGETETGVVTEQ